MTKKRCVTCGRAGKQVRARDDNTSGQVGSRRCECRSRKGCKRPKTVPQA